MPVIDVLFVPHLLADDRSLHGVLLDKLAKMVLLLNFRSGQQVFLNDAIALDECSCAVLHDDAGSVDAMERVPPVIASRPVIDRDPPCSSSRGKLRISAGLTFAEHNGSGTGAVVEDPQVFEHEVSALDREDALDGRFVSVAGAGQGDIAYADAGRVFDFKDRLVRVRLNDPPRSPTDQSRRFGCGSFR